MIRAYGQLFGESKVCVGKTWIPFASEKRFQLLAYLAYQGDWVSRSRLTYVFWSDLSDEAARRNLRKVVHKLRKLPWLHGLEIETKQLRWVATDVADFRRGYGQGDWANALGLYRDPLLSGMAEGRPRIMASHPSPIFQSVNGASRRRIPGRPSDTAVTISAAQVGA